MALSSNAMEVSPLGLRSLTVLPRALLEVSPDPCGATTTTTTNNTPANINSPLQTSPPGWFVNPFGQPLTLIYSKTRVNKSLLGISQLSLPFLRMGGDLAGSMGTWQ